ncbi:MAG TPA: HAD family hydrolase [bacterium]|nr:HAD family hydrolase [bacterium]
MDTPALSSLPEPRLITFDFGDTLVTSEPEYLERVAMGLTELGHPRSVGEVKAAYFEADLIAAEELIPRAPFTADDFRRAFSTGFFRSLGLLEKAAELGPPLTKWLIELRPRRVLVPGGRELLARLSEAGYPLGIISNNDGNTREKCESVDIAKYFFFILDSTLEGVMKPDPRIFQKALRTAGVRPFETLHVGDLWGCDCLGARAAAIPAVWLGNDIVNPQPVPGTMRINSLLELLDAIKL